MPSPTLVSSANLWSFCFKTTSKWALVPSVPVIPKSLVASHQFGQHGCPGTYLSQSMPLKSLFPNPLPPADDPGSHHGRYRDCSFASVTAFGAHVSHLPGHVEEHNDHQGVPAQVLLGLHRHCPAERVTGGTCLPWGQAGQPGRQGWELTLQSFLPPTPGTRSALPAGKNWYPSGPYGRTPTSTP